MPIIEQNFSNTILNLIASGSDGGNVFDESLGHFVRANISTQQNILISTYRSDLTWPSEDSPPTRVYYNSSYEPYYDYEFSSSISFPESDVIQLPIYILIILVF